MKNIKAIAKLQHNTGEGKETGSKRRRVKAFPQIYGIF